jgi:hypothetical protein
MTWVKLQWDSIVKALNATDIVGIYKTTTFRGIPTTWLSNQPDLLMMLMSASRCRIDVWMCHGPRIYQDLCIIGTRVTDRMETQQWTSNCWIFWMNSTDTSALLHVHRICRNRVLKTRGCVMDQESIDPCYWDKSHLRSHGTQQWTSNCWIFWMNSYWHLGSIMYIESAV